MTVWNGAVGRRVVISEALLVLYVYLVTTWNPVGVASSFPYLGINTTFLYDPDAEWNQHQLLLPVYNSNYSAVSNVREIWRGVNGTECSVLFRLEESPQATVSFAVRASSRPVHLLLTRGKINTFKTATSFSSSFGPVPVISIYPFHHWHAEGIKFSNGFIPRFGQEMKGRALVDILIQNKALLDIRQVLVLRSELVSPELSQFYSEMNQRSTEEMNTTFSVKSIVLNSKSFLFGYHLDEIYHGSDVIIVDCALEYFEKFSLALTASDALNNHAWIVFMHDFLEIQNSSTVSAIADTLQDFHIQLFSFCQTVRDQTGSCTNFSDPTSVYYHLFNDTLTAVSQAVFNPSCNATALSHQDVHLSTIQRTLSVLEKGAILINSLEMQCVDTVYGKLALTTGRAAPHNCADISRVQFQFLSFANIPQWTVAGRWTATRQSELTSDIPKFVHDSVQDDVLTFSGKLRVLYGPGYPPFTYSNATHNYSGVDFDLLFMIADELGIKKQNIEVTPLDSGYSWSDMVAMTGEENSKYDLAIGGITVTAMREKTSNFTRSYVIPGASVLVVRQVDTESNYMWRFFGPFKWTVWIFIVGIVVLSSFAFKWLGLATSYRGGMWLSSIILFAMNENRLVAMRNPFGRMYITALNVIVLILVSAYTANMATFLTSQMQSTEIQGLSSLKRQPVAINNVSIIYTLLQEETDLRKIVPVTSFNSEMLRTGEIAAYVGDTPFVIQVASVEPQCDLYVLEDEYFRSPFAFAISDKLVVTHGRLIDDLIADAVARHLVSTWYDMHLLYNSKCDSVKEVRGGDASSSGNLDVDNLGGVFIITVATAVICFAVRGLVFVKQQSTLSRVAVQVQDA